MTTLSKPDKPLREVLNDAVIQRERMLQMGWSRRKDHDRLNAAIGRAKSFLISYPFANDLRVRGWCLEHHEDVAIIVPGNAPTSLARLIMHALKPVQDPVNKTTDAA